jgi:hypothetical protein
MKKLTAIIITIFFVYTGFSQGLFRVQAGPVFNYLKAEGDGSFVKVHVGYTVGVGYEMIASNHFSVQPEFNFIHLKTNESVTNSDIKFDYLQIPVLLKGVTSSRNFSVYAGPQISFLTKSSLENGGNTSNIKDDLTQTDFSGVVGFEYIFPLYITLNARFTQGFSNVYKAEFDSPNTTRHQYLTVTVGYVFAKKKHTTG